MQEFYAESSYELDVAWARASLIALLENPALGKVWIADSQGVPAGYAVLTVRYTMEFGGLSGYVDDLFVRPGLRRQGAGRALLYQLFEECHARDCKSVQVEVGEGNAAARALYAEFGLVARQDGRVLLCGPVSRGRP